MGQSSTSGESAPCFAGLMTSSGRGGPSAGSVTQAAVHPAAEAATRGSSASEAAPATPPTSDAGCAGCVGAASGGGGGAVSSGGAEASEEAKLSPARLAPKPLEDSEDEDSSEDQFTVAPLGPDGLPSVGSAGHRENDCKRCCFYPKGRCTNGHDCKFCHFDHDKRRRMKRKKKKGTSSELTTPCSVRSISLASGLLSTSMLTPSGSMLHTPSKHHAPMTPLTPSMPPLAPPSIAGLKAEEAPPPPQTPAAGASAGAALEGACQGGAAEGGVVEGTAAEIPLWPPPATAAAHSAHTAGAPLSTDPIPTPMGLVDLSRYAAVHMDYPYAAAAHASCWGVDPYAAQWSYAGLQQDCQLGAAYAQAGHTPEAAQLAAGGAAEEQSQQPRDAQEAQQSAPRTQLPQPPAPPAPPPREEQILQSPPRRKGRPEGLPPPSPGSGDPLHGLEKDSPRSAILTMVGAWGALTASKPDGAEDKATLMKSPIKEDEEEEPPSSQKRRRGQRQPIDRRALLGYRAAFVDCKRPGALKAFKSAVVAR